MAKRDSDLNGWCRTWRRTRALAVLRLFHAQHRPRWFFPLLFVALMGSAPGAPADVIRSMVELNRQVGERGDSLCSLSLTGVVLVASTSGWEIVLQDESGAALLQVPEAGPRFLPGQRIALTAEECVVFAGRRGLVLGAGQPVVDNDGDHALSEKSRGVWVGAGRYPVRVLWFNAQRSHGLKVSHAAPGQMRRPVPDRALSLAEETGQPDAKLHGLAYRCFEGSWKRLPDFTRLQPVRSGRVANFDIAVRSRDEDVGVEFSGWMELTHSGMHTFFLESDDGSQWFLGRGRWTVEVLSKDAWPAAEACSIGAELEPGDEWRWVEVEGVIKSVSSGEQGMHLDLTSEPARMELTVVGSNAWLSRLTGCRVRVAGALGSVLDHHGKRRAGRLLAAGHPRHWQVLQVPEVLWQDLRRVPSIEGDAAGDSSAGEELVVLVQRPSAADANGTIHRTGSGIAPGDGAAGEREGLELLGLRMRDGTNLLFHPFARRIVFEDGTTNGPLPTLTTIEEVRELHPEQAEKNYPVRIRGVVTLPEAGRWGSVHDGASGINVLNLNSGGTHPAEVGDFCEIEGETRRAGFGPMMAAVKRTHLGDALLPEPLHPSYEQLMNGSLDGQWVEVEGGVLAQSVDEEGTTLLVGMIGGRIPVLIRRENQDPTRIPGFTDALVRVRGVVMPVFNEQRQIQSVRIFSASTRFVSLVEPVPEDFFAGPARSVRELLFFDPRAISVRRVKVRGQIIHAGAEVSFLMDEDDGLRFMPRQWDMTCGVGDIVEVVGYPELSGGAGAPMLRESKVKRIGHGPLPPPRVLSGADLLDARNDATRVRVECRLVSISLQHGKPVWEFQVGTRSGTARLGFAPEDPPPVGAVLEVTGVFAGTGGNRVTSQSVDSFELLVQSPDDVVLRSLPPWWTFRRTMVVLGALLGILGVTGVWVWLLRRQVEERTAQLAAAIRERQRVEQQEAVERERARVAQDLHDELGAGLTEVGILGSLVKNPEISPEQKAGYLEQVIHVSRGLVTALDEIVWAVNPRYDSLGALRGYFSLYAERFLELSGTRCFLPAGAQLPEHPLDSRTRHSLFLAFKEALVNVVKHAGATEVRLGMRVDGPDFLLSVTDNGRGFSGSVDQPGMDGLRNMHERLRQLGGECRIESRSGQGTTVTFRLPLHG